MRKKTKYQTAPTHAKFVEQCLVFLLTFAYAFLVVCALATWLAGTDSPPQQMERVVDVNKAAAPAAMEVAPSAAEIDYSYTADELAVYKSLGAFVVTGYCPCHICCGEWAENRPEGVVYTASGAVAEMGITCGSDWDILPSGTEIYIEGVGNRVVQDNGSAKGRVLDVYCDTHEQAQAVGKSVREVLRR